nr:hypothetical protein [Tanacetum cinerariifolium]
VEGAAVAAAHEAQNLVRAALQRQVEVRHKAPRSRHSLDNLVGQQIGLARADAEALNALDLIQGLHQLGKVFLALARRPLQAKIAQVHAR